MNHETPNPYLGNIGNPDKSSREVDFADVKKKHAAKTKQVKTEQIVKK